MPALRNKYLLPGISAANIGFKCLLIQLILRHENKRCLMLNRDELTMSDPGFVVYIIFELKEVCYNGSDYYPFKTLLTVPWHYFGNVIFIA